MSTTIEHPMLFKVPEAAQMLGISRTTLYELMRAGELRPVRIGRSVRLSHGELQRWIDAREDPDAA